MSTTQSGYLIGRECLLLCILLILLVLISLHSNAADSNCKEYQIASIIVMRLSPCHRWLDPTLEAICQTQGADSAGWLSLVLEGLTERGSAAVDVFLP